MKAFSLFLLLAPTSAFAQTPIVGIPDYATYQDPVLRFASFGIPTAPLRAGLKQLKVVPAYMTGHSDLTVPPATGVGILYKPWNLGMTWVPNIYELIGDEDEDVGSNLLTISKTFVF